MNRQTVLAAALDLLVDEGAALWSMRRLAARLGCTTGVLYHHFADKEEIFQALAERGLQEILELVSAVPYDPDRPVDAVLAVFRVYLDGMLARPAYARMALLAPNGPILAKSAVLPQGISKHSPTFSLLTQRLRDGMERGLLPKTDPELLAQSLWSACFGLLARLLIEPPLPPEQVERLKTALFQLLERSLRPYQDPEQV